METKTLELTTPDGPMPVYEARPDGTAAGAVVVIHEAFGVNEHIEDVTRRFAQAGYEERGHLPGSIGVVGFCIGGRFTFLACARRALGAGVTFSGGGIASPGLLPYPALIDEAPRLETPWLGLFGDQDASIPVGQVEALRDAVAGAPVDADVVRYADADHGFHRDVGASYHEASAGDAWRRTLEWFGRHRVT